MKKILLPAIAAVFVTVASSEATLLTTESFDYTSAANITGQSGGSGWRSPSNPSWETALGKSTGTVNSSGLSYTSVNASYTAFAASGNSALMSGDSANNRYLAIDSGGVYDTAGLRNSGGNFLGGSGVTGTLWSSVLMSSSNWSNSFALLTFDSNTGTGTAAQLRQNGSGGDFVIRNNSGGDIGATGSITKASAGTIGLFVFRYDFNAAGNDTLSVWLNPTSASDTAAITATQTDFILNNLMIRNANGSTAPVYDEIRFGTTFADVVPIPEPTTWALIAGSLTALVVFRRRRTNS